MKSKTEISCYKNGKFGAIAWAIIESFTKAGVPPGDIAKVINLMNTYFPNLDSTQTYAITKICYKAFKNQAS